MSGYISKDFVHMGCGLPFEPERVWKAIPYSVRKNINRAQKEEVTIEKVSGSAEHIDILRSMWYDPDDPNMPNQLSENEYMFIARDRNGNNIGATILLPVGNHLFLNNLAGSAEGKKLRVQDFLLWHVVNFFADSRFKYLDVGVSYRPSLYRFFIKWQVISYPVIFNKPEISFKISANPFTTNDFECNANEAKANSALEKLKSLTGIDNITFVPDEKHIREISAQNTNDFNELTFQFPNIQSEQIASIDLRKIFPVQFGWLLFGVAISDAEMWNQFHCLDVFKRNLVLSQIDDLLDDIDGIKAARENNFKRFASLFAIDDILPESLNENIRSYFFFKSDLNKKYHAKLDEFDIEHFYQSDSGLIGLPVHQNLRESHLNYIYGIYRGILNLCSEWEHTDNYDKYK